MMNEGVVLRFTALREAYVEYIHDWGLRQKFLGHVFAGLARVGAAEEAEGDKEALFFHARLLSGLLTALPWEDNAEIACAEEAAAEFRRDYIMPLLQWPGSPTPAAILAVAPAAIVFGGLCRRLRDGAPAEEPEAATTAKLQKLGTSASDAVALLALLDWRTEGVSVPRKAALRMGLPAGVVAAAPEAGQGLSSCLGLPATAAAAPKRCDTVPLPLGAPPESPAPSSVEEPSAANGEQVDATAATPVEPQWVPGGDHDLSMASDPSAWQRVAELEHRLEAELSKSRDLESRAAELQQEIAWHTSRPRFRLAGVPPRRGETWVSALEAAGVPPEGTHSPARATSKALESLTLAALRECAASLGIAEPAGHKGHKATWVSAIEAARGANPASPESEPAAVAEKGTASPPRKRHRAQSPSAVRCWSPAFGGG